MSINKHLKFAVRAILFFIFLTIVGSFYQATCYAAEAKDFTVSFDTPVWTNKDFSYKDVSVVKKTSGTSHIYTLSVHTTGGYISKLPAQVTVGTDTFNISWNTDLGKVIDGTPVYQTAFCSLGGAGDNQDLVAEIIKAIVFRIESYADTIDVSILADGQTTSFLDDSNLGDYKITRGEGAFADHYYLFVPLDSTPKEDPTSLNHWKNAYKAAQDLVFMGANGYLATITDDVEDEILDKITTQGAWAGGAMISDDYTGDFTLETLDNWLKAPSARTDTGTPDDFSNYTWKWVCGPEGKAKKPIFIGPRTDEKAEGGDDSVNIDGYSVVNGVNKGGYAVTYGIKGSDNPADYSNWNRTQEAASRPDGGDEPNNCYSYALNDREYCLSVHYKENGERSTATKKRLGWNDLPEYCDNGIETYISGYFVEFSDFKTTTEPTSVLTEDIGRAYTGHIWKYEKQDPDAQDNSDTIVISCVNDDHIKCDYKDTSEGHKQAVLTVSAQNKLYDTKPNPASFSFKVDDATVTNYSEFDLDEPQIEYVGTNGTSYSSNEAPVNSGNYIAKIQLLDKTTKDPVTTIQKAFSITKAPLTIALNNQIVYVGDDIKRNYDSFEEGSRIGLIKSISGFMGDEGKVDELNSISESAITPNTTSVKSFPVGYKSAGNTDKMINIAKTGIVIKDFSGNNVTANYDITIVPGDIEVTKRPTKKTTITDNPVAESITYGYTLRDSEISGFCWETDSETEVYGEFSWNTPDTVPDAGEKSYPVTFSPSKPDVYLPPETPIDLTIKVNPKDIATNLGEHKDVKGNDIGIDYSVSIDPANSAVVTLYDKQTGHKLTEGETEGDYVIHQRINDDTDQVEICIEGKNNYKGKTQTFLLDAHTKKGFFKDAVVIDSSADDIAPKATTWTSKDITEGKKLLADCVSALPEGEASDKETATKIVKECNKTADCESATGYYKAVATLTISDADYVAAGDESVSSERQQKECAEEALTATSETAPGKKLLPKGAKIGMYFDLSMNLQYDIYKISDEQLVSKNADQADPIYDMSPRITDVDVFDGISERITITVPDKNGIDGTNLRGKSGYTRTYYIIRTHGENGSSPYVWDVLDVTRNGYELTFETNKFSKYALAYTDVENKKPVDPPKGPTEDPAPTPTYSGYSGIPVTTTPGAAYTQPVSIIPVIAPNTGDNNNLYIAIILIMAGLSLFIYALASRKETVIKLLLVLAALILIAGGLYFIAKDYLDNKKSDDFYDGATKKYTNTVSASDAITIVDANNNSDINTDILSGVNADHQSNFNADTSHKDPDSANGISDSNKEGSEKEPYDGPWESQISVDLPTLCTQYPDVKGWLFFENEDISYPILQGESDEEYIRTSYLGQNSSAGSIFMEALNSPDFSDPHTIIYGHNMRNRTMFGSLRNYLNTPGYYDEHQYFQIITLNPDGQTVKRRYRVFAYGKTNSTSKIYTVCRQHDAGFADVSQYIQQNSAIRTGISLDITDQIVTLSTCKSGDSRLAVSGVMISEILQ